MVFPFKYNIGMVYLLPNIKSRTCFYIGLASLCLQFLIFLILLQIYDENKKNKSKNDCLINIDDDIKSIANLGMEINIHIILLEEAILSADRKFKRNMTLNCHKCPFCKPLVLGIDGALVNRSIQLISGLIEKNFSPATFYNIKPYQTISELNHVINAIFIKRSAIFQIIVLYPREDNSWWFGDIHSDPNFESKLASINLTDRDVQLMKTESVIERFEMVPTIVEEGLYLMSPKNINIYLSQINNSKFVECNFTRAALFRSQFGIDTSAEALRFRHKVWKMLSRAKTVFESLGIVFWLSSGTLLGYYRECDIIAHSKDVDIGVWAEYYHDGIIREMHEHGFRLKIKLGFPNDSLELSFLDQSGIKLDIFFFYKDENAGYWNGGTQVKSGKKFKYLFPKFTLCWTLFKDLRVRIPCETETYIRANYGPNWFTPVKLWDWKSSPFNVQPNDVWRKDQLSEAIKLYV